MEESDNTNKTYGCRITCRPYYTWPEYLQAMKKHLGLKISANDPCVPIRLYELKSDPPWLMNRDSPINQHWQRRAGGPVPFPFSLFENKKSTDTVEYTMVRTGAKITLQFLPPYTEFDGWCQENQHDPLELLLYKLKKDFKERPVVSPALLHPSLIEKGIITKDAEGNYQHGPNSYFARERTNDKGETALDYARNDKIRELPPRASRRHRRERRRRPVEPSAPLVEHPYEAELPPPYQPE